MTTRFLRRQACKKCNSLIFITHKLPATHGPSQPTSPTGTTPPSESKKSCISASEHWCKPSITSTHGASEDNSLISSLASMSQSACGCPDSASPETPPEAPGNQKHEKGSQATPIYLQKHQRKKSKPRTKSRSSSRLFSKHRMEETQNRTRLLHKRWTRKTLCQQLQENHRKGP